MNRRKNLVALQSGEGADGGGDDLRLGEEQIPDDEPEEEAFAREEYWDDEEDTSPSRQFGWVLPTLAVLAALGWTGFFGWVHRAEIGAGASPEVWTTWIVDWSIPVLLVIALWLLAMRNSRREAAHFGDAAAALAAESTALERRLSAVNRELSLARDFIASQSRDLESLGRVASERLSTNADRLQELIRDNGEQVDRIGRVSDTALGNMDRLRDQLPVLSNAARDLANQIGNAGNTAQGQIEEMVEGFDRLNQSGEASGRQVDALRGKVGETLTAFEAQTADLDRLAQGRFETLRQQSEDFRLELEARETDTLAAIRRRADELEAELAARHQDARTREDEAMDAMRARIAELREAGERTTDSLRSGQAEASEAWTRAIDALEERMKVAIEEVGRVDEAAMEDARNRLNALTQEAERVRGAVTEGAEAFDTEWQRRREEAAEREAEALAALQERIDGFDRNLVERQEEHLAHVSGLAERGDALAQRLAELDREMQRLAQQGTDESERLGQSLQSLADKLSQSRAVLEESGNFVGRLTDDSVRLLEIIRSSAEHSDGALSDSIGKAEQRLAAFAAKAASLRNDIGEAEAKGGQLSEHVDRIGENGAASLETLEALETRLASLASQSGDLAEQARRDLREAIATLEEASGNVLVKLRSDQSEAIREIAERVGVDGSEALARALRDSAADAISELEEASRKASESGRETAVQLRDQLAMVNELAGNLEQRVTQARARAEEQVDTDFTRRMALITESLNSSAIDISKAFDTEVTDTAWNSYLRGDRGIFTRRAVRLLDNREARAVVEIYEEDSEFRETVNRYIHDFENMLRTILSTRDGNALAVTLLSSDMGKLYVALAQAIERLRN